MHRRRRAQCRHADVMHRAGRRADHATAQQREAAAQHDHHAEPGQDDGDDERQRREADIVADGKAGDVGELGDEMRRPDARAEDDGRRPRPGEAAAARQIARPRQQIEPGVAGEETDQAGQRHQPEIVLLGEAAINSKHRQLLISPVKIR